ncbi:uncharacterized protein LOC106167541 [Lingula anatina]|uniref:Uncharacterized protein LOC106167541 n=1 Tax=Lingula anatina TaxID=7574 RepID=A0A1S3IV28_LINAN|nr:uncharacterized protein LOC106167541 [Lingula anatina]|eukprot:XP_013401796.1 uncharacterized protein LOC106167541 [Lingula anatina]
MKDLKTPEGRLCEYCKHKEAILLCQGCPKTNQLCATCRELHDSIPALNGHHFVPLSQFDFSVNPSNIREQLRHVLDKAQYCDKHDGELLTLYCEEDDNVACRDCILETHSKHDFKKIGDVVKGQRELIQEKLRCLPSAKPSHYEIAEKAIVRTEERLTENQSNVLSLVDSQKLAMTKEIMENSETIERELSTYYQQVEKDVRRQIDEYLTSMKHHLETYQTKVLSDYIEMQKVIDDKSNEITAEVMALTSTQLKTLEAEKDKQEIDKISIQSIREFAQQLTTNGSAIEVMTHSKKLQARIQELQTVEPVFDTKITDVTLTPGLTEMDRVLQFPKIPEPKPLSIKTGSITAKTYRDPLDACFGSLKQEGAHCPELMCFQKATWFGTPERKFCFNIKGWPLWDIQCTDDGCILVGHSDAVSVFSSAADRDNDRVVVLGLDGTFLRNILTKSDNTELPLSVSIASNGELVVGSARGKVSTYKYIA